MSVRTVGIHLALLPGNLLAWLLVGLIAGALASWLMRGRGFGCIGDIIVGLVGAVIGGFLAGLLGVTGIYGFWSSVLIAFIGACILVAILRAIGPAH